MTSIALGEIAFELRKKRLDAIDDFDGVAAGLALDVDDDRGGFVHPGGLAFIFDAIHDFCDVGQHDGRTVAVGDDYVSIILAGYELIVGVDLVVLAVAVEISFRGVDAGLGDSGAKVLQINAVRRKCGGVGLNADSRLLAAADGDEADVAELGNFGS